MKPKITEEYALELAQRTLKSFYRAMKKAGYELTPIPEFGDDPEKKLLEFFYNELKETYSIVKKIKTSYLPSALED